MTGVFFLVWLLALIGFALVFLAARSLRCA